MNQNLGLTSPGYRWPGAAARRVVEEARPAIALARRSLPRLPMEPAHFLTQTHVMYELVPLLFAGRHPAPCIAHTATTSASLRWDFVAGLGCRRLVARRAWAAWPVAAAGVAAVRPPP